MEEEVVVQLYDGDGINILKPDDSFVFECCDCSLRHIIRVRQHTGVVKLTFTRVDDFNLVLDNHDTAE